MVVNQGIIMYVPTYKSNSYSYFNYFFLSLLIVTAIKIILAATIPITGDEAYFTIWGEYPRFGYYDHTPLIGWLLYLTAFIGKSALIIRLPTIITTVIMGFTIYAVLKSYDEKKAALLAILFLISPMNVLGILISTDTPLILFSFLSSTCLFLAIKNDDHLGYYFLAGIFLGLAFFSKYFAVLLGLAYLLFWIITPKNRKRSLGILLVFACILPFGFENFFWNYHHAWANISFNIFNRNAAAHFSWKTILLYLVILFYLITPVGYFWIKNLKKQPSQLPQEFYLLSILCLLPLTFYLLLSSVVSIGLHWPLAFISLLFFLAFRYLNPQELVTCLKFTAVFSAFHLLLVTVLLVTPMSVWAKINIRYVDFVFFLQHQKVSNYLRAYNQNFITASPSYAKSAIIHFDGNNYSPVFGHGGVHGREDDLITDFRKLDHRDFLIFDTKLPSANDYQNYFKSIDIKSFNIDGATFYYLLGYDFNYKAYRDNVLKNINEAFWQIPSFLPHAPSFYYERYLKQ